MRYWFGTEFQVHGEHISTIDSRTKGAYVL